MSPWIWNVVSILFAVVTGWGLSGVWRGTTQRGYLLALDHVEEMTSRRMTGKPLPEALMTLRKEAERT